MKIKKLVLGQIDNNTYILSNDNKCVVIDPSMEYEKIKSYIDENDLTVEAILITHAHFDHVYSLYELKQDTGAKVYMHEDDLELLDMSVEYLHTKPTKIDVLLKGDEELSLIGETFKVLHTPGHAKGCVCYIVNDCMFTGDTIFKDSMGRIDLMTSQPKVMYNTLQMFTQIGGDYKIYCGHGEDTTYKRELEYNPYLRRVMK